MAASKRNRSNPSDPASGIVREKIRTSQLVNRLCNHALGKNKMTSTQVRATEILLRKTVPDLSAVEVVEAPTEMAWIGPPPLTEEEWEAKHGPETKH